MTADDELVIDVDKEWDDDIVLVQAANVADLKAQLARSQAREAALTKAQEVAQGAFLEFAAHRADCQLHQCPSFTTGSRCTREDAGATPCDCTCGLSEAWDRLHDWPVDISPEVERLLSLEERVRGLANDLCSQARLAGNLALDEAKHNHTPANHSPSVLRERERLSIYIAHELDAILGKQE